jgi:hypothetical protein
MMGLLDLWKESDWIFRKNPLHVKKTIRTKFQWRNCVQKTQYNHPPGVGFSEQAASTRAKTLCDECNFHFGFSYGLYSGIEPTEDEIEEHIRFGTGGVRSADTIRAELEEHRLRMDHGTNPDQVNMQELAFYLFSRQGHRAV